MIGRLISGICNSNVSIYGFYDNILYIVSLIKKPLIVRLFRQHVRQNLVIIEIRYYCMCTCLN
jgi:hypothetical protein